MRPALKINLKSEFFKSIIIKKSESNDIVFSPTVIIRNGVVIDSHPNVQDVKLPSYVKTIEDGAFKGCTALTSVSLPGSLTDIDSSAFKECPSLTIVRY